MNKDIGNDIISLSRYVMAGLHKSGHLKGYDFDDSDLAAVGNLAGVQAFNRWDESKGTLSTWLVPRIRGAILDYVNKEASHGMGGKTANVCVVSFEEDTDSSGNSADFVQGDGTDDYTSLVDTFTYKDTIFETVPEDLEEPEVRQNKVDLRKIVISLGNPCSALLTRYFGLDGEDPESLAELEIRTGVKLSTNYARLQKCLEIAAKQLTGDTKNEDM